MIHLPRQCSAILFIISATMLLCTNELCSQTSYGGHPIGLLSNQQFTKKNAPIVHIPDISEAQRKEYASSSLFALPQDIDIKESTGIWQKLPSKQWMWHVRITVAHQKEISFVFEQFALPAHSRLFIYNAEGSQIHGAYTSQNNEAHLGFMSDMVSGSEIIIEYVAQSTHRPTLPFHISKAFIVTNPVLTTHAVMEIDTGFLASRACHPNANCSEGDRVADQKKSVCRILMVLEEGLVYCSGTLMNNTLEDQRPLILSALHCQDTFTPMHQFWRFDFDFMSATCENPASSPSFNRIIGCRQLAGFRDGDMLLLELLFNVPASFDVFYAGWDLRSDYVPQPAYHLHHPLGDMMKVSVDGDDLVVYDRQVRWDNETVTPPDHHFRCVLDTGAHEIGSSGGPLLDTLGRVVGQLHGGGVDSLDCTINRAFFGRIALAWEGGGTTDSRLKDWLDPFLSDVQQFDGLNQGESDFVYDVIGIVELTDGTPLTNVEIDLSGEGSGSTFTNAWGEFTFEDVPLLAEFSIRPSFADTNAASGVSSTDVVLSQRSIIGLREYDNPIQKLAADVSGDGNVSATDLVQMINVILGLQTEFGSQKVWKFFPEALSFPTQEDILFTAYKLGDLNFSVELN